MQKYEIQKTTNTRTGVSAAIDMNNPAVREILTAFFGFPPAKPADATKRQEVK